MISYKYKLYKTDKTKHLDRLLRGGAFVESCAFHSENTIACITSMFQYSICRSILVSDISLRYCTRRTYRIIQRLDIAYRRFFDHLAKRPPKFKKAVDFCSIVFKQGGYFLNGNEFVVNKLKKKYKLSLSREYRGNIKRLTIKRNHLGEYSHYPMH